jgi:CMP-N,N'-diacetyllegionaminic acid synthase
MHTAILKGILKCLDKKGMSQPKILCLIPARAGSKGIPNKNVKAFCGKPLIAWSIEQALAAQHPMRVIVTTDSEEFAAIARRYGAEVPFLRPAEISQDRSIDEEFVAHALDWLLKAEGYVPDIIVHLRPTYPTRSVTILNSCVERFLQVRDTYDSLRTLVPAEKTPYKMYRIYEDPAGVRAEPLFRTLEGVHEPFSNCRQALPPAWVHNCCIDILNAAIVAKGTMAGDRIYPFFMKPADMFDIDTEEDWATAEESVRQVE